MLALSGVSDYLDGKLAQRWNQISGLGRLLDPAADRLYILSTLVGLTWREILPLWLTLRTACQGGDAAGAWWASSGATAIRRRR